MDNALAGITDMRYLTDPGVYRMRYPFHKSCLCREKPRNNAEIAVLQYRNRPASGLYSLVNYFTIWVSVVPSQDDNRRAENTVEAQRLLPGARWMRDILPGQGKDS